MKKIVWVYGLIAGGIVSIMMVWGISKCQETQDYNLSMWMGYTSMLLAFSMVFVGIKNFRDKYHQGSISFKKAFLIGLYITLIACTMYVIVWMIDYHYFIPDFMDKYSAHMIAQAKASGANQADIDKQIAEMAKFKEMYKNPVFMILMTYAEIIWVGLIISLISALILKRKPKEDTMELRQ